MERKVNRINADVTDFCLDFFFFPSVFSNILFVCLFLFLFFEKKLP